jgi:hypothetical protein
LLLACMGILGELYKQGGSCYIGINQPNTRASSKACNEQLGVLKRIRLEVLLHYILVKSKNHRVLKGQARL